MDRFKIAQVDQTKFIKINESTKEITNPSMFNATGGNTPDGLLSNKIFGITKTERSGIFGYIDLHGYFINPYYYKIWSKIDKNLKACVYETDTFRIDSKGYLVQDDNGETGLKFLYKNRDKIRFKETKKSELLAALTEVSKKDLLFTNKFIVTPPYYRDVDNSSSGRVGVGEVNKLYIALINAVNSVSDTNDYGLDMGGAVRGRIQDTMLEIYNWYTLGESIIGGEHTGSGIFKKFGAMRRTVMGKTTDYAVRLVISSADIEQDSVDDLMVDLDYSAIPLASALIIAYPFIIYELRSLLNNEFGGKQYYTYIDKKGQTQQITLDNPQIAFSDDVLDKEINEFIHGYSNRFKPIRVPNKENKEVYLKFKGYSITADEYANGKRDGTLIDRYLTWMDLFYIAACKATKDRMAIIVRYPIDSYMNQLYTMIHISSTIDTKPVVIDGELYRWYPDITQDDIGTNTSNKFVDTLQMSNLYCGAMSADFDGDQTTVKMVFSEEANEELKKYAQSNAQYISTSGSNARIVDKEAVQAMYNLTLVLPDTKLTDPVF